MKGNEKNIPVFKRKLEELQANYMMMDNIINEDGRIFYKDIKKKMSFKEKIWKSVRDSNLLRNILLIGIDIKALFKKKWFVFLVGYIIMFKLVMKVQDVLCKNSIYIDYWKYVCGSFMYNLMRIGIFALIIMYAIKKKKHFVAVIAFTLIWFSISLSGPLGEISQFLDFHYVISENYVEDVETITDISITDNKEIDIETNNNKFILYCDHRYYDDIIEKYYIGDVVKIKYLPNTKNILDIKLF